MKRIFLILALLVPFCAFAQEVTINDWLGQVLEFFKTAKDASGIMKASGIVFLLVGLMKVSKLSFIWDSFGKFKPFVAPVLALIGAVLSQVASGGKVDLSIIILALTHGAGSLALADLFDALKKVPGISKIVLAIIELIEKILVKKQP